MIRPYGFGVNPQTEASNAFQYKGSIENAAISTKGLKEFDNLISMLKEHAIPVLVVDELPGQSTPDAVFINNWISFHPDGTVVLYPMESPLRRRERRYDILEKLGPVHGYDILRIIDFSCFESRNQFLESTGSIVFDYVHHKGYICRSSRSSEEVVQALRKIIDFEPLWFDAKDRNGKAIYHTNVMMCIGDEFAVVCLECIPEGKEKDNLIQSLKRKRQSYSKSHPDRT